MEVKEFINLIDFGHDIEFVYNNENYSITNTSKGYSFVKFGDPNPKEFKNGIELVSNIRIGNKNLKNIISEIKITNIY